MLQEAPLEAPPATKIEGKTLIIIFYKNSISG